MLEKNLGKNHRRTASLAKFFKTALLNKTCRWLLLSVYANILVQQIKGWAFESAVIISWFSIRKINILHLASICSLSVSKVFDDWISKQDLQHTCLVTRYKSYIRLLNVNKMRLFIKDKLTHIESKISLCLEAVAKTSSVKKLFLEISQNTQENTCARVSILIKLQAWFMPTFSYKTPPVAASVCYEGVVSFTNFSSHL